MKARRSERIFIYIEPERKARIVTAALRSGSSLSEFVAASAEKVMDKADGVRDQLAPFLLALEQTREDLRYDLRSHANQNAEENRLLRRQVREFIDAQEHSTREFMVALLDKQAKAIHVAVDAALQAAALTTRRPS